MNTYNSKSNFLQDPQKEIERKRVSFTEIIEHILNILWRQKKIGKELIKEMNDHFNKESLSDQFEKDLEKNKLIKVEVTGYSHFLFSNKVSFEKNKKFWRPKGVLRQLGQERKEDHDEYRCKSYFIYFLEEKFIFLIFRTFIKRNKEIIQKEKRTLKIAEKKEITDLLFLKWALEVLEGIQFEEY